MVLEKKWPLHWDALRFDAVFDTKRICGCPAPPGKAKNAVSLTSINMLGTARFVASFELQPARLVRKSNKPKGSMWNYTKQGYRGIPVQWKLVNCWEKRPRSNGRKSRANSMRWTGRRRTSSWWLIFCIEEWLHSGADLRLDAPGIPVIAVWVLDDIKLDKSLCTTQRWQESKQTKQLPSQAWIRFHSKTSTMRRSLKKTKQPPVQRGHDVWLRPCDIGYGRPSRSIDPDLWRSWWAATHN